MGNRAQLPYKKVDVVHSLTQEEYNQWRLRFEYPAKDDSGVLLFGSLDIVRKERRRIELIGLALSLYCKALGHSFHIPPK